MIHKKQKQKTALFLVQVIVIIINTFLFASDFPNLFALAGNDGLWIMGKCG